MLDQPPTCSLSPVIPNNACHLRITAAAGTKLAVASSGLGHRPAVLLRIGSLSLTVVYIPKDFIPHAASLRQAFAHCGRFVTAAPRGGLGSVSVPMCRISLSAPVSVIALVGLYPTNKLMEHGPLPGRKVCRSRSPTFDQKHRSASDRIRYYQPFRKSAEADAAIPVPRVRYPCITHPFATIPNLFVNKLVRDRSTCMSQPRRQRSF